MPRASTLIEQQLLLELLFYSKNLFELIQTKMKLYVKTSEGLELPPPYRRVTLLVDECAISELSLERQAPLSTDAQNILAWLYLVGEYGDVHIISHSTAIEASLGKGTASAKRIIRESCERAAQIIGTNKRQIESIGPFQYSNKRTVIDRLTYVAIACAEIAWVRRRYLDKKFGKDFAQKNIREFKEWHTKTFSDWPLRTSTLLCIAAMAGNEDAATALKLKKKDANEIRNGAFDTLHLEEFSVACGPNALLRFDADRPSIAVLITGDKDLYNAVTSFKPAIINNKSATRFDIKMPFINEGTRIETVKWLNSGKLDRRDKLRGLKVGLMALKESCSLLGHLPSKLLQIKELLEREL